MFLAAVDPAAAAPKALALDFILNDVPKSKSKRLDFIQLLSCVASTEVEFCASLRFGDAVSARTSELNLARLVRVKVRTRFTFHDHHATALGTSTEQQRNNGTTSSHQPSINAYIIINIYSQWQQQLSNHLKWQVLEMGMS
jgi:hypothetical protein